MKSIFLFTLFALILVSCTTPEPSVATVIPLIASATVKIGQATSTPSFTITPTFTNTELPTQTYTTTPTFDRLHIRTATPAPAAVCPTFSANADPAPVVDFPPDPLEIEQYTLDYLNTYGPLPLIKFFSGENDQQQFLYQDLTNDGIPEIVLSIGWPGIRIFGCQGGTYVTQFLIVPDGGTIPGYIEIIKDFNQDGMPDLFALTGIMTRETFYRLIEWDGNRFSDLISNSPDSTDFGTGNLLATGNCGKVYFQDIDDDGFEELILFDPILPIECRTPLDGLILPWRDKTEYYRWDGYNYTLYQLDYSYPAYRFQAIQDGDRYTQTGNYEKALGMYQAAITSSNLEWWSSDRQLYLQETWNGSNYEGSFHNPPTEDMNEFPNLAAYAYYRILIIYSVEGEIDKAKGLIELMETKYPSGKAGYVYTELANTYWNEYQTSNNIQQACGKAIQYIRDHQSEIFHYIGNYDFQNLGKYYSEGFHGFQSLEYTPEDICPFK